jgi:hypothetical protein
MSRNSCLACRAENLPNAIACVTCGTPLFGAARGAWSPTDDDWVPPMPVDAVVARRASAARPGADGDASAEGVAVPPRPDRDDA